MKTFLWTMAAIPALAIAAPAAAQYQTYPNQYQTYPSATVSTDMSARINALGQRLDAGIRTGVIDRTEARTLRAQLRALARRYGQYNYNGLTGTERADLQQRMRVLRRQVRLADGGTYDRYDRFASEDAYGTGGYYGRGGPYDADGDGWDDRDCDRDGDIDSGSCDTRRGGIGGFIENILGVGGLRVGQRVTGELYGLPPQYQDRFRDGYGYVYRSDGRRIYQIDARTATVVRVHPM
jgi:hypothetical protein